MNSKLAKRHLNEDPGTLQNLGMPIPWQLYVHAASMLLVFAILFPLAYLKTKKRPFRKFLPLFIFNLSYILGHFVSYSPVDTHFHKTYQKWVVLFVNIAIMGNVAMDYIQQNIPRLRLNPSNHFSTLWNALTMFTLFMLPVPQMLSGFTAILGVACVEHYGNCLGHFVTSLVLFYLILLSIFISFKVKFVAHLKLEKIISWVYVIFGTFVAIWYGLHKETQHESMGVILTLGGLLSLFFEYRLPNDINPIIWITAAILGLSFYYHHQATVLALMAHKLCGICGITASIIRIIQQYWNLTEEIKRLSELFFLFSSSFLFAGMEEFVLKAGNMTFHAYANIVVVAALMIYSYFIILAYYCSEDQVSLNDSAKKTYNRIDSADFSEPRLLKSSSEKTI